ncbi:MAG: 4'-phosphopantetheinyl transferase superfamily protein [Salinivirgaceae bacterium]|nr:4'-phosphopantetheinyl transferase superfamily protein [Salinivirgaceae bacterium]MDD4748201.1 4'-phosphopantetheinyl transferase superfamily protein [Salinivirgaceae bacterium]MDY0280644.1 4'-phosphopantetheinyl transferase superfamily protein [Salinivirgaceae bacterium]
MPLVDKRICNDYSLVIWSVEGNLESLLESITLTNDEHRFLEKINNTNRKIEWLTVRYIIQNELGITDPIGYDENGKPGLPNQKISISHSKQLITVLVSLYPCAIDIEQVGQRVGKIAHKAFNESELQHATNNDLLTILWCTKETVYKLYGEGSVDFKTDITVLPIENEMEGSITCYFEKKKTLIDSLQLETLNDYKLVWIVDKKEKCHGV